MKSRMIRDTSGVMVRMRRTMALVFWVTTSLLAGEIPGMVLAASGHHGVSKELAAMMTNAEKEAVASVDGDPTFIVGVRGLAQSLCFRIEGQAGQVIRLLQDPQTGVVVNARISHPVADSSRTYLSAVLISRRNFRLVAKVGRVLVNRYRFAWGPVSVRLVHGHRVMIAPTLLALTLRNMNVTLVVKRHLPEGRRLGGANDTNNSSSSSPHIASTLAPDVTPPHHHNNATNVASRSARRRTAHRRRPDDIDHGPRVSRRRRRPSKRGRKKEKNGGKGHESSSVKSRTKRETSSSKVPDLSENLLSLVLKQTQIDPRRNWLKYKRKRSVDSLVDSSSESLDSDAGSFGDFEETRSGDSRSGWHYSSDSKISGQELRMSPGGRSRRSVLGASRHFRKRDASSSRDVGDDGDDDDDESSCFPCRKKGPRFRGGRRRVSSKRPSRPSFRDGSRVTPRPQSRKSPRGGNSRRSPGNPSRRPSRRRIPPGQSDDLGLAGDAERNVSSAASGDDAPSGSGVGAGSGSGGGGPIREMVAYVGFYIADSRDLSSQTHGLLGQFLHKNVTLQKVRRKANGVMKARLLVEPNGPRPQRVKASMRPRFNMALNQSIRCWWLKDAGQGVVDGEYEDYLAPRFRDSEFLPLPPGLIGQ